MKLSAATQSALDELKLTLPADLEDNTYALNLFKHLINVLEKSNMTPEQIKQLTKPGYGGDFEMTMEVTNV